MDKKYLISAIIILAIIIHSVLFLYFIINSPLVGDGPTHQSIFEGNIKSGEINKFTPYLKGNYGFPRFIEIYPVTYPPLYHTFGSIIYLIFPIKTVYIIDFIISILIGIFGYLLIKKIDLEYKKAIIFMILLLVCSGLILTGGNNNFFLLFGGIITLYCYIAFLKIQKFEYFILFLIFFLFSFGTKQLIYFLNFAILIHLTIILFDKKYAFFRKKIIFSMLLIFILIIPIVGFQIYNTGTLSTPAVKGWPIIDNYLKPKYLELEIWQQEIDYKVNITNLHQISAGRYYQVNPKLKEVIYHPVSLFDLYFNFNNNRLIPEILRISMPLILFFILWIIGLIIFLRESKLFLLVLLIVVAGLAVVFFTSKVEYYLFLPFFGLIFLNEGINCFKNKRLILIILSFIIIISIIQSATFISVSSNFLDKSYMRAKTTGGYNTLIELSGWLKNNSNETDLIMAGNTQDLPYYTKRNFFWDYRLFFLNQSDLIYYLPKYPNLRYIIITDFQIKDNFENWVDIPKNSEFLVLLKNESYFKLVYNKEEFNVYEFKSYNDSKN